MAKMQYKHKILSYIYQMRVLTLEQICTYIYDAKSGEVKTYAYKTMSKLCSSKLLEKKSNENYRAYYLITKAGIKYLKENGLILVGSGDITHETEFITASSVKISESVLTHQVMLNTFVLGYEKLHPNRKFEYYDEKFLGGLLPNIRPDGAIKTDNTIYFLEMDMSTERKNRLVSKWDNYRNFLNSGEYWDISKEIDNIKVLFILNKSSETRQAQLRRYIYENIGSLISDKFNIYIEETEKLNEIVLKIEELRSYNIKEMLIKHDMNIYDNITVDESLSNFSFTTYIALSKDQKNIHIIDNIPVDFVVDDFTDGNEYTYKKLSEYPTMQALYYTKNKRNLKYLIVVNDINEAYWLCKQTDSYYDNCYFTTLERLNSMDFFNALFQIDRYKSIVHFEGGLNIRVNEGIIGKIRK